MNSKQRAREVAAVIFPHVKTLLMAKAAAELERERVDAITRRVLSDQVYTGRRLGRNSDSEQFRVTDPADTWLMSEHDFAQYHGRMQAIHLADGFQDAAKGFCPALVAEHLKTKAEWALIAAAEKFFPGCDNNTLLCGTKDLNGLECRKKFLNLLIGLVVNCPGCKLETSPAVLAREWPKAKAELEGGAP